jgi:hypothetical protein
MTSAPSPNGLAAVRPQLEELREELEAARAANRESVPIQRLRGLRLTACQAVGDPAQRLRHGARRFVPDLGPGALHDR